MYTCTCNNRHLAVYGLQFPYPLILLLLGLSSFSATATPLRVRQSDTRSRDAASGAGHGEADGQPMVRETQLQELLGTAVEVNRYKKAKHAHVVNTSQPCQLQLKHYNMPKGAQLLDLTNINACTHLAAAGLHDGYGAQLKRRLGKHLCNVEYLAVKQRQVSMHQAQDPDQSNMQPMAQNQVHCSARSA